MMSDIIKGDEMLEHKKTNGPGATLHRRHFMAGATAAGALLAAPRPTRRAGS